eukprot:SAG22_NODE_2_length_61565_cov_858.782010_31_plen_143_part_00
MSNSFLYQSKLMVWSLPKAILVPKGPSGLSILTVCQGLPQPSSKGYLTNQGYQQRVAKNNVRGFTSDIITPTQPIYPIGDSTYGFSTKGFLESIPLIVKNSRYSESRPLLIVVDGIISSGKSTLLLNLKQEGFTVYPEPLSL